MVTVLKQDNPLAGLSDAVAIYKDEGKTAQQRAEVSLTDIIREQYALEDARDEEIENAKEFQQQADSIDFSTYKAQRDDNIRTRLTAAAQSGDMAAVQAINQEAAAFEANPEAEYQTFAQTLKKSVNTAQANVQKSYDRSFSELQARAGVYNRDLRHGTTVAEGSQIEAENRAAIRRGDLKKAFKSSVLATKPKLQAGQEDLLESAADLYAAGDAKGAALALENGGLGLHRYRIPLSAAKRYGFDLAAIPKDEWVVGPAQPQSEDEPYLEMQQLLTAGARAASERPSKAALEEKRLTDAYLARADTGTGFLAVDSRRRGNQLAVIAHNEKDRRTPEDMVKAIDTSDIEEALGLDKTILRTTLSAGLEELMANGSVYSSVSKGKLSNLYIAQFNGILSQQKKNNPDSLNDPAVIDQMVKAAQVSTTQAVLKNYRQPEGVTDRLAAYSDAVDEDISPYRQQFLTANLMASVDTEGDTSNIFIDDLPGSTKERLDAITAQVDAAYQKSGSKREFALTKAYIEVEKLRDGGLISPELASSITANYSVSGKRGKATLPRKTDVVNILQSFRADAPRYAIGGQQNWELSKAGQIVAQFWKTLESETGKSGPNLHAAATSEAFQRFLQTQSRFDVRERDIGLLQSVFDYSTKRYVDQQNNI